MPLHWNTLDKNWSGGQNETAIKTSIILLYKG